MSFNRVAFYSLLSLGIIAGAFLLLPGDQLQLVLSDVISPVIELLAAAALFVAARRALSRSRRQALAWGLLSVSLLLYMLGDVTWAILELVLKQSPFPSLADIFYLADYLFFLLGIVLLMHPPASRAETLNNALDLSTVLVVAILGFWNFLIGPTLDVNSAAPPLEQAILLAYPVADLVLLGAFLLIVYGAVPSEEPRPAASSSNPPAMHMRQPDAISLWLLAAGLVCWVLADCLYSYQALSDTYISGGWLDLGWIAASMLFGLAGVAQWGLLPPPAAARVRRGLLLLQLQANWIRIYLPYIWLLGAFILLLAGTLTPLHMSAIDLALGVGLVLTLVIVRQLIMLAENRKMNLQLESQAAALQGSNRDLSLEIAGRQRMEERLAFDVLHDQMTGLANRILLLERLGQAIQHSRRHPRPTFALLFMDLDQFKVVNDSLGHSTGDQLLIAVAQRLKESLRSTDTVARFGGDEFAILLNDIQDLAAMQRVAEKIQSALARPFRLHDRNVHISASIGIATDLVNYDHAEDLLRDADLAMYEAKALGKARSEMFRVELRDRAFSRLALEEELRRALECGEFRLYYQPISSLESGQVVGMEALLRWMHPARGLLLPAEFITVAEESGLILPIGAWVLEEACRQLKAWQDGIPAMAALTVNVNISDKEFAQRDLVGKVAQAVAASGLRSGSLRLEITERVLVDNIQAANAVINALQEMGVRIQIDDFGTGYSGLAYLQHLPIDGIKIDKSFINAMVKDRKGLGLVRAMVSMARELRLETIAEGIETGEQLNELKGLLCGFGQGFLLSVPLDPERAGQVLAAGKPHDEAARSAVRDGPA